MTSAQYQPCLFFDFNSQRINHTVTSHDTKQSMLEKCEHVISFPPYLPQLTHPSPASPPHSTPRTPSHAYPQQGCRRGRVKRGAKGLREDRSRVNKNAEGVSDMFLTLPACPPIYL